MAEAVDGEARHASASAAAASISAERGRESATSLRYIPAPAAMARLLPAGGRTYGRGWLTGGGSISAWAESIAGAAGMPSMATARARHNVMCAKPPTKQIAILGQFSRQRLHVKTDRILSAMRAPTSCLALLCTLSVVAAWLPLAPRALPLAPRAGRQATAASRHAGSLIRCCEVPEPEKPAAPAPAGKPEPDDKTSENWSGAGIFTDDEPLPLSFWLFGRSPRRAILPTIAIWGILAPAVNLWGSGSLLASLAPETSRDNRLDTFYPVGQRGYPYAKGFPNLDYNTGGGFKRYVDDAGRFEFRFPAEYVQDAAVFMKKADAAYTQRMMDPTLAATSSSRAAPRSTGPDVAFGPAGGTGAENLSVVVGSLAPGFSLRGTLGPPEEAAARLLRETIAKEGVREATLLSAVERLSAKTGKPLYQVQNSVWCFMRPSGSASGMGARRGTQRNVPEGGPGRVYCSVYGVTHITPPPPVSTTVRVPRRLPKLAPAADLHRLRRRRQPRPARRRDALHVRLARTAARLGGEGAGAPRGGEQLRLAVGRAPRSRGWVWRGRGGGGCTLDNRTTRAERAVEGFGVEACIFSSRDSLLSAAPPFETPAGDTVYCNQLSSVSSGTAIPGLTLNP